MDNAQRCQLFLIEEACQHKGADKSCSADLELDDVGVPGAQALIEQLP